jgi:hypothetical protein
VEASHEPTAPSRPVVAIERAILHRLCNVLGAHRGRPAEIGDAARHLQNPIVRARRKPHPPHSHFERPLPRIVERADFADRARRHPRIVESPPLLHCPRRFHPRPDLRRRFRGALPAQFLERHRGHFHVNIDAVQERSADLPEILLDLPRRAPAFARGVSVKPALAPVQITTATEYEAGVPGSRARFGTVSNHLPAIRAQDAHVAPAPSALDVWGHLVEEGPHPSPVGATRRRYAIRRKSSGGGRTTGTYLNRFVIGEHFPTRVESQQPSVWKSIERAEEA